VEASQAGQEVVYHRVLFRGFGYTQSGPTEILEDNVSSIMMSETPTGHVKLLKCAGPQNVSDALTKSLPRPAVEKHREFMVGTRTCYAKAVVLKDSACYAKAAKAFEPIVAYAGITSISCLFLSILRSVLSLIVRADNYSSTRGRAT
jgi:hypothetical protein